jgi:stage IV sporulation protein FB
MLWSLRVATIAGTVVRVHVTFVLFLVWIAAGQWRAGGREAALDGVLFILLVFACVLAHEFGHIFAARRYGIRTPDVTLWPIGGVASLERIPQKPSEELIVALAGPAVNVVIAAVLLLILGHPSTAPPWTWTTGGHPSSHGLRRRTSSRCLQPHPGLPYGRGRVLRAVLPCEWGGRMRRVWRRASGGGGVCVRARRLFVNRCLSSSGFSSTSRRAPKRSMSPFRTARTSCRSARPWSARSTRSRRRDPRRSHRSLIRTSQKEFPVVDAQSRPRGLLTKDGIIRALRDGGPATPGRRRHGGRSSMPQWRPLRCGVDRAEPVEGAGVVLIVDDTGALSGSSRRRMSER